MRITLVIGSLGPGGAERNLLRLGEGLTSRNRDVSVLTLNPSIPDFYPLPAGLTRTIPPSNAAASPRWFDLLAQLQQRKALKQALLGTNPDIVISFIDTCNIRVLGALHATGIPVIVSERIDWRFHPLNWRWSLMRRAAYPFADRVVSLARAPLEVAAGYFPSWPCAYIPNPVPQIRPEQWQGKPLIGKKNLIAMGRLVHQKGFDLLIHAFAQIHSNHPDWALTILGDGPLRDALVHLTEELNISESVDFRGNVSAPFPLLQTADLFVFSSRYEAFGMALAEAMACGLPVISFDCPSGPSDIVRGGIDGILVPAEDSYALATAMNQVMEDPHLRCSFARRAPEVCTRFAPDSIFDQWGELIDDVIAARRGKTL